MQPTCFMIQPFDGGKFDKRFDDVFAPAVEAAGLRPYRVDRDAGAAVPIESIERGIRDAATCFADVTADNPNVWFELGYAIAANKDICIVCSKERNGHFPFDIQHRHIISYTPESSRDFASLGAAITERLSAILRQQETRTDIQTVTKGHHTGGLTDFEVAALAALAGESYGLDGGVSVWSLKKEMEKAGYNNIATNIGARGLLLKAMIRPVKWQNGNDEPEEGYAVHDSGWEWISSNTHALKLQAKPTPKSTRRGSFDRTLDEEIPF